MLASTLSQSWTDKLRPMCVDTEAADAPMEM